MAISEDKSRVTITLSNGLLEKLDSYCDATGQTRSGYIASVVGRDLYVVNRTMGGLSDAIQGAFGQLSADFGGTEQKLIADATPEDLQRALWGEAYGQRPAGL